MQYNNLTRKCNRNVAKPPVRATAMIFAFRQIGVSHPSKRTAPRAGMTLVNRPTPASAGPEVGDNKTIREAA
jgi:hypothetical protein